MIKTVSLHDPKHIDWWEAQENVSRAIRGLIEAHINRENQPAGHGVNLGELRQVFEAVLDEKLAGVALSVQADSATTGKTDTLNAFDNLLE